MDIEGAAAASDQGGAVCASEAGSGIECEVGFDLKRVRSEEIMKDTGRRRSIKEVWRRCYLWRVWPRRIPGRACSPPSLRGKHSVLAGDTYHAGCSLECRVYTMKTTTRVHTRSGLFWRCSHAGCSPQIAPYNGHGPAHTHSLIRSISHQVCQQQTTQDLRPRATSMREKGHKRQPSLRDAKPLCSFEAFMAGMYGDVGGTDEWRKMRACAMAWFCTLALPQPP